MEPILVLRAVIKSPEGILLIQRSKTDSLEPNIWEFPGGKVETGETIGGSLRREVREETKITGTAFGDLKILKTTVEEMVLEKYQGQKTVKHYIFGSKQRKPEVVLSDEHRGFRWVKNLSDLASLNLNADVLEILQTLFNQKGAV